jgi:flagellar motility protein MotE (MotC chaperone)
MSAAINRTLAAAFAGLALATAASAQNPDKPSATDGEIARYCGALAPSAREARAVYQLRKLADLEHEVRDAVEKLEAKEMATREWVTKRETMMKSATDDVVAIYAKMAADAAAGQLSAMDEPIAAAVLAKLKPQAAGAILGEMQADKAAKLSSLIAGAGGGDKS